MQSRVVLAVLTTGILALAITASAQKATLTGQVVDTTGAALPGVVVRAIHEATGTTTEVVTDARGVFRIPTRIGAHQITAELAGFTTVTRTGVSLSVGQEITVNLQLSPSTLQETVTVTGEAPLVNPTGTRLSGVVDTRQVEELPVNGRNFLDLTLLARGATANHAAQTPTDIANRGDYQMNIDGQQVTTQLLFRINPTFSRDAIAEFEFVANRFDATQGRTHGAQLNVITKSGTNTVAGTFAGYFRDDRFNAPDFIQRRVLPYSNQQISGTLGGPIVRNRAHFFGSYEYGREPQILTFDSPYPFFNIDSEEFAKTAHKFLGRVDLEVSRQMHLSVRHVRSDVPKFLLGGGALLHPSATSASELHSNSTIGTLTQILGNRAVNEVKVGYSDAWDRQDETLNDPFTQSLLPTTARGDRVMCLRLEEFPSRLQRVRARPQLVGVGELIPDRPDVVRKPRRGRGTAPNLIAAHRLGRTFHARRKKRSSLIVSRCGRRRRIWLHLRQCAGSARDRAQRRHGDPATGHQRHQRKLSRTHGTLSCAKEKRLAAGETISHPTTLFNSLRRLSAE